MTVEEKPITNSDYERFPEVFPAGMRVRYECEWQPGKWSYGTVACHQLNEWGMPQWIIIEGDDGSSPEYDYRYLDVEDFRQSLVRPAEVR